MNLEELARVAHSLGEVVGLGLRNLAHCPVELNLMPETTRRWQTFNEKKPYLMFSVFSLVAVVGAMGLLFQNLAGVKQGELEVVTQKLEPLRSKQAEFNTAYEGLKNARANLDQLTSWMEDRYYWANVLSELRRVFIKTEQVSQEKLKTDTGVWIEYFLTMNARVEAKPFPTPGEENSTPVAVTPAGGSDIAWITLQCRAINLQDVLADANTTIIYTLENQLKACPLFDPAKTQLSGNIVLDEATFSFKAVALLKHPLKL